MEVCTSFAQVGQVPKGQHAAQVSRWRVHQTTTAEVSLGQPSPSRQFPQKPLKVHRLEAALSALGDGNPLAKPLGVEALRVQEFRRTSKEKSETQNRRFDTRTRFSEGGHTKSAPRSVDGRSASCGVNSSNLHVFCARRMVEQQELRAQSLGSQPQLPGWGLWWHRGQLSWQVLWMQPVGDGQARSSVMAVLIDQADAKRRCVEVVPSTLGNHVEEYAVWTSGCSGW